MIKYTVASDTMVLSMEENWIPAAPEHAKKTIMPNAEMSDMTCRERLAVATRERTPDIRLTRYGLGFWRSPVRIGPQTSPPIIGVLEGAERLTEYGSDYMRGDP
jgi:hypothetical protein